MVFCKYPVNPWSAVEVAIRALPQERFAFCRVSIAGRIALPLRSAMSELRNPEKGNRSKAGYNEFTGYLRLFKQ